MRFRPKAKRANVPMRRDIKFEDYDWDTENVKGWHPMVVLHAKEKETKNGDDMWVIDFGIDLPDGEKGRVRWTVPETFPPKVEMLQEVLLPEFEEEENDFELSAKVLMFRSCVGLIEPSDFEREDGKQQWEVVKLLTEEQAEKELGADWMNERAPAESDNDDDDEDVFGDD